MTEGPKIQKKHKTKNMNRIVFVLTRLQGANRMKVFFGGFLFWVCLILVIK